MKFSKAQQFLFQNLVKERKSPCFEVRSNQIEILKDPVDYYLALHKLAKQSQTRISMSALYLGTGKLEQYLVERLDNKLQTNSTIKMNILLDYMRGTRVNSKDGMSSLNMLKVLKEKHLMRNLRIGFWHNPDTGFLKGKYFSGPMKEIFGVHHIKAHIFDHNVVITGANLSEDYFTDRQDRCYIIQDCEPLANYLDDLISSLTDCAFNVDESGNLKMLPQYAVPYQSTKKFKNQMSHHLRFFRFNNRTQIPTNTDLKIEDYFSEDKKQNQNDSDTPLLDIKSKPFKSEQEPIKDENVKEKPQDTSLSGEEQILIENTSLPDEYILNKIVESSKNKKSNSDLAGRVFIFPTLQMNVIKYREDEELLLNLLKFYGKEDSNLLKVKIATGYFNLQQEFIDLLNKYTTLKTDILTSSPRANGFYKAGRFKKYIPGMYRANEYTMLKSNASKGNVKLFEYENGEWTYHAKGAWFYEKDQPEVPQMTVIGSSNYSYRSNRRDTECQLYIVSECDEFKKRMHDECEHLFKHSQEMNAKSVLNDGTDKLKWSERILNKLLKILL